MLNLSIASVADQALDVEHIIQDQARTMGPWIGCPTTRGSKRLSSATGECTTG